MAEPTSPTPAMTQAEHDAAVLDSASPLMNVLHPHHAAAKAQAEALHGGPPLSDAQAIQVRIAALEGDLAGPAWSERHPQHAAVKAELDRLYGSLEATRATGAAMDAEVFEHDAAERDVLRAVLNVNPARLTPEQLPRWSAKDEGVFLAWGRDKGYTSTLLEPMRDLAVALDGVPRAEAEGIFRERFAGHVSPADMDTLIAWYWSSEQ